MATLTTLVLFVFGILNLILFFKIWGMTNDVSVIKEYIVRQSSSNETKDNNPTIQTSVANDINVGDLVVRLCDEQQLKVVEIVNGKYHCFKAGTITSVDSLNRNEIELFDKYWLKKNL